MIITDDPIRDAEKHEADLEERQPYIYCAECGARLYVSNEYYSGDYAWNFGGNEYFCDECAKSLFRKELMN